MCHLKTMLVQKDNNWHVVDVARFRLTESCPQSPSTDAFGVRARYRVAVLGGSARWQCSPLSGRIESRSLVSATADVMPHVMPLCRWRRLRAAAVGGNPASFVRLRIDRTGSRQVRVSSVPRGAWGWLAVPGAVCRAGWLVGKAECRIHRGWLVRAANGGPTKIADRTAMIPGWSPCGCRGLPVDLCRTNAYRRRTVRACGRREKCVSAARDADSG